MRYSSLALTPQRQALWRLFIAGIICCGALFGGCSSKTYATLPQIRGAYAGTIRNTTGGITAPILLNLQQAGTTVNGYLTVGYPLSGSGPLKGSFTATGALTFEVQSADRTYSRLEFSGELHDATQFSGTYLIDTGESGVWTVTLSQ